MFLSNLPCPIRQELQGGNNFELFAGMRIVHSRKEKHH
jgi:hypothetical protein